MKTIDIKGKAYVPVSERLRVFREKYENFALVSEIVELTSERVVIKASVIESNGFVWATGYAYEDKDSTFINKTSFIENCETSAWGRALFNFMPVGDVVASAEDMDRATAPLQGKPWLNIGLFTDAVSDMNHMGKKDDRQAH